MQGHATIEPAGTNHRRDFVRLVVHLSDDRRLQRHAAPDQVRTRCDEHVEAFLPHVATDGDDAEHVRRRTAIDRGELALHQIREFGVQPVVHAKHGCIARELLKERAVCFRARDREPRRGELAPEQAGRIERRRVQVLRMSGERERPGRHHRRQPCNGRRTVAEVSVQMPHLRRVAEAIGQGDRLQEFLRVHLARRGPDAVAGAHGLRERGERRPNDTARPPDQRSAKRRQEQRKVCAQPPMEWRSGNRSRLRQILRRRVDAVHDRVTEPIVSGLDHEQSKSESRPLETVDLACDEQLGETWIAFDDVGDVLTHTRLPAPTRASACSTGRRTRAARHGGRPRRDADARRDWTPPPSAPPPAPARRRWARSNP